MATTIQPPSIEERKPTAGNGGGGGSTPPADSQLALTDFSPPPTSTAIWVLLFSITMTFLAFTSALIVRRGSALDWEHLALPPVLYLNTIVLIASSVTLELGRREAGAFMAPLRNRRLIPVVGCMPPWALGCFLWLGSMSRGCNCGPKVSIWPPIPTVHSSMC